MLKRVRTTFRNFFFPPRGSPRWMLILPYGVLGILTVFLLVGGAYAWDYTNSPSFCGTTCHTMPPEYAAYQVSPHARIACVECHIGREFIGNQIFRKAGDVRHILATTFRTYEYPIMVKNMRPARETCEKCHSPEKFSDDSLRVINHFKEDKENTPYSIYLVTEDRWWRQARGVGARYSLAYRESGLLLSDRTLWIKKYHLCEWSMTTVPRRTMWTSSQVLMPPQLSKANSRRWIASLATTVSRITCTLRRNPSTLLSLWAKFQEIYLKSGEKGVEALRQVYSTQADAQAGIAGLGLVLPELTTLAFTARTHRRSRSAIAALQQIYSNSVFPDQKVNWDTHPSNIGHINSPGCFRCHDGKHLDARSACHSTRMQPVPLRPGRFRTSQDFVANIEISRGPEPEFTSQPELDQPAQSAPLIHVLSLPHHG